MAEVRDDRIFGGRRIFWISAVCCLIGLTLCGIGLAVDPARTWFSYLMAYTYAVSIAVGGLVFLMISYATNGRWMSVVRRLIEVVTLSLPALALLFIPIPFGLGALYPWKNPPASASPELLQLFEHRSAYLNVPFFVIRGAIYFAIWIVVAGILRRWSVRRDRAEVREVEDPEAALGRERVLSAATLPLVALAITFAAFDWLMALEPRWFSTIFGIYYFAGGFVAALALITILAQAGLRSGHLEGAVTPNHFHCLGRLMFAFVIFWAYTAFFQAMLIAIANKPDEVMFYIRRTGGSWKVFIYILVLGQFGLPFLALLPRRVKFRPKTMAVIAGWLLLMHLADVYWMVIPAHAEAGFAPHGLDIAALLAVLGGAVACASWRQRRVSLLAEHDPYLAEGLKYRSPL